MNQRRCGSGLALTRGGAERQQLLQIQEESARPHARGRGDRCGAWPCRLYGSPSRAGARICSLWHGETNSRLTARIRGRGSQAPRTSARSRPARGAVDHRSQRWTGPQASAWARRAPDLASIARLLRRGRHGRREHVRRGRKSGAVARLAQRTRPPEASARLSTSRRPGLARPRDFS